MQGTTILESCLHTNLSEHLNSEIGLGTITNTTSAKEWLRNSFLFQRIQKNPKHYALGKGDKQTWEERVDDLVMQSVEKLQKTELVAYAGEGDTSDELSSTEYGDIMSKVCFDNQSIALSGYSLTILTVLYSTIHGPCTVSEGYSTETFPLDELDSGPT